MSTSKGSPRVYARVRDSVLYGRIKALREEYRNPINGKPAPMTDVVLAFLSDGMPLMDTELRARARAIGGTTRSLRETWEAVIRAGLDALEKRP